MLYYDVLLVVGCFCLHIGHQPIPPTPSTSSAIQMSRYGVLEDDYEILCTYSVYTDVITLQKTDLMKLFNENSHTHARNEKLEKS